MHVTIRINTQCKPCFMTLFDIPNLNTVLRLYLIFWWIPDEFLRVNVRISLLFSCCVNFYREDHN